MSVTVSLSARCAVRHTAPTESRESSTRGHRVLPVDRAESRHAQLLLLLGEAVVRVRVRVRARVRVRVRVRVS